MTRLEKLKNDVLVGMRLHISNEAMLILENVLLNAMHGIEVIEEETLPAAVNDTNKYIIELFMARKAVKLSQKTVMAYMLTLKEFMQCINKALNKVNEADIEYYSYCKKKKGNSNTTLNNQLRNLSAFYTWMRKVKIISENPCEGIEPYAKEHKPIEYLTAIDVDQVKNGCTHSRDHAMLEFFRSTAMRKGEIPQVKISDIDFRTGKLLIYGEKAKRYRTVMLDKVALHYISKYLEERNVANDSDEALFTHIKGDQTKPLRADGIYAAIKAIARRSSIVKNVYPHIFRKTTATNICKRGGSIEAAGEYLGHAPQGVTAQHYAFRSERDVEQIFHSYVELV